MEFSQKMVPIEKKKLIDSFSIVQKSHDRHADEVSNAIHINVIMQRLDFCSQESNSRYTRHISSIVKFYAHTIDDDGVDCDYSSQCTAYLSRSFRIF